LPEFDGKNFIVLWSTHREVDISSFLVGGVGFSGLQQWADVPALNALVHDFFTIDFGEQEVRVSENAARG
jgi:hypothetical protein